MQAVTFQGPGEVRLEERPEPELIERDDAVVRVEATGVCGSDLHIYHGRVAIEPGFTLGHEFVGTVIAAGDAVTEVSEGDRVLGCYCSACGNCFFCRRGDYHKCDEGRVFGHGKTLGALQGAQADQVLVPHANLTLRRVPEGMSDDAALFAGDVMGTGYHAVAAAGMQPGDAVAVLGLGPVGLCAVQAARAGGASQVIAIDTVADRLATAEEFGAQPVHLTDDDPRAAVKAATEGRGVDVAVDAVGHPDALELACRLARKAGAVSATGVYAERIQVHMGIVWIKALTITSGHANVIGHVDRVLADDGRRGARPDAAREPAHEPRGGARGVRGLRPARGTEDRDAPMSEAAVAAATGAMLERRRAVLEEGAAGDRLEGGLQRARHSGEARDRGPAGGLPVHRGPRWPTERRCRSPAGPRSRSRRWRSSSGTTAARSSRCCPRSRWPTRRTSPGTSSGSSPGTSSTAPWRSGRGSRP